MFDRIGDDGEEEHLIPRDRIHEGEQGQGQREEEQEHEAGIPARIGDCLGEREEKDDQVCARDARGRAEGKEPALRLAGGDHQFRDQKLGHEEEFIDKKRAHFFTSPDSR